LASTRPDVLPPKKRNDLIQKATLALEESQECRQVLAEWNVVVFCFFPHAFRRVAPLFTSSICQQQQQTLSNQSNALLLMEQLCLGLSILLQTASDVDLLETCATALSNHSPAPETLANMFYKLAQQQQQQALTSEPVSSAVIPAIAIGAAICQQRAATTSQTKQQQQQPTLDLDWCSLLLQYTITKFSTCCRNAIGTIILTNCVDRTMESQYQSSITAQTQIASG
jgi:hypothetical protein